MLMWLRFFLVVVVASFGDCKLEAVAFQQELLVVAFLLLFLFSQKLHVSWDHYENQEHAAA